MEPSSHSLKFESVQSQETGAGGTPWKVEVLQAEGKILLPIDSTDSIDVSICLFFSYVPKACEF